LKTPSKVYKLSLPTDWKQNLRYKCLTGNAINGLVFVSVLFHCFRRDSDDEDSEYKEWSNMVDFDQWLQIISKMSIAASLSVLLDSSGQIGNLTIIIKID
jgi:hypothetical protein